MDLNFIKDQSEFRNIKIFFDSYFNSFMDETFLSLFLEKPSNQVIYLSFNGFMLEDFVSRPWLNTAHGEVTPTEINPAG